MKAVKILDVDFIGGQEGLTKEEETALSAYFSSKKLSKKKQSVKETMRKKRVDA